MRINSLSKQIIVIAAFLSITMLPLRAEIVALKMAWSVSEEEGSEPQVTLPSDKIVLQEGQVAKVVHFHCFESSISNTLAAAPTIDGQIVSDASWLSVSYEGLKANYSWAVNVSPFGIDFQQNEFSVGGTPVIVGPAEIELQVNFQRFFDSFINSGGSVCVLEVEGEANLVSNDEIVITPDEEGPVEIVLESSTDMKQTWERAALGTYGVSDEQRFFRLRALHK